MGDPSPPPSPAGSGSRDDEYRRTPFLSILLYVLGFMAAMAALAFLTAWLMRH